MGVIYGLAAAWGLAEATLFFVVPDVLLSFVALRSRRAALIACLWAFAGALAGGALMYAWGAADRAAAESVLERVPAIDRAMIDRVRGELEQNGPLAVALGPLKTTPYKIYAVEAGDLGLPLPRLLAPSLASRLGRFLLVAWIASWLAGGPLAGWSPERRRRALIGLWIAIYVVLIARS